MGEDPHFASVVAQGCDILAAYQLDDVVELIGRRVAARDQVHCVVVAGEVGRGKSALINALLGQADIVPVAATVTTMIPVSIVSGVAPSTVVFAGEASREVSDEEFAAAVTGGDGGCVGGARTIVGSALGDVTVIDTPGVGALAPEVAQLAAATTYQACILVLVCDAGTPLTDPEMRFARAASRHADSIILAVTKTDQHLLGWRAVVAENRRLLRVHLGQDVPVIGVSAERALQARGGEDPGRIEREEIAAGIVELRTRITGLLSQSHRLPQVAGLRLLATALNQARDLATADLARVVDSSDRDGHVAREKQILDELHAEQRQWEYALARDLSVVRDRATENAVQQLDRLRTGWAQEISRQGVAALRRHPTGMTRRVQHDIEQIVAEVLTDLVTAIRDDIVAPRFVGDPLLWDTLYSNICDALAGRELDSQQVPAREGVIDPSLLTMGVVGSSVIGGLIGVSSLVGVGALLGGVWVATNMGYRAVRSGRHAMLAWLRETTGTTSSAVVRIIDLVVTHTRTEVAVAYRERLRILVDRQQTAIADLAAVAGEETERRRRRAANLRINLRAVDEQLDAVAELLAIM